jgi:hypothetical protein
MQDDPHGHPAGGALTTIALKLHLMNNPSEGFVESHLEDNARAGLPAALAQTLHQKRHLLAQQHKEGHEDGWAGGSDFLHVAEETLDPLREGSERNPLRFQVVRSICWAVGQSCALIRAHFCQPITCTKSPFHDLEAASLVTTLWDAVGCFSDSQQRHVGLCTWRHEA